MVSNGMEYPMVSNGIQWNGISNGILLLSHKKEWDLAICDNMDRPREYYAKWNKSKKANTIQFTYLWNLKNKANKRVKKAETASQKQRST